MALITLDKKAYEHNLTQIASKAGGFDKIICVLKDNAYGHGIELIAPLAKDLGINFIALKNETQALFLQGFFKNILILSHRPNGQENPDFIYALNAKSDLQKLKKGTRIHLAIDTGMHRNGLLLNELEEVFDKAKRFNLYIEGLFTHFAGADELDSTYFVQKNAFEEAKQKALNLSSQRLIFHSHNSAALFRCDALPQNELCRVGLAQFGYNEFNPNLQRVLKLYAHRLSFRTLKAGQSVGYGGVFRANKELKIATYDLGYADGLLRYNGKGELKLANGACLLGRMSMDSFSCEDFGEELCVFDDVREWAKFFHTIEYEILVKLSPFIPRALI